MIESSKNYFIACLSLSLFCILLLTGCEEQMVATEMPESQPAAETSDQHTRPAEVYRAKLRPLNGSDVRGTAIFRMQAGTFTAKVNAKGHGHDQSHPQHVHGFATGEASECPPPSADTDEDGFVSVAEGAPFYGGVLVPLDGSLDVAEGLGDIPTFPTPTNRGGAITYDMSIATADLALNGDLTASDLALDGRAVVLHGEVVGGTYVPTLPVACGVVERVN